MKYITLLIVTLTIYSCGSGVGPTDYEEIGIYEYDIKNDTQQLIKKIGEDESYPTVRYFNNSNDIIYGRILRYIWLKVGCEDTAHGLRASVCVSTNRNCTVVYYGRYHSFTIIKENGSEEIIDLGSIYIDDDFFSISPNDKSMLFAGTVIEENPQVGTTYKDRGIYKYDLETHQVQLLVIDSINALHYPTISHSGNHIVYKSQTYQGTPSTIFMCDISGSNIQRIATNEYDLLKFAVFSEDDQNIVFIESSSTIRMYNISTKETTTLLDGLNLFDGSATSEYPMLNTYQKHLYYYARVRDNVCAQANVFSYSFETKQSILIASGVAPMSINDNYLLIKDSFCFGYEATDLKLTDKNGVLIKSLSKGYGGEISNDNSSIVYVYSATKSYE